MAQGAAHELRMGILGPLEVHRGASLLALGGRQQRAVLALLVLDRGRTVSVDRIADALWGDRPPPSYVTTVQTYVSHLRAALEPDRPKGGPAEVLVSSPGGGYRLDVPADAVDVARFEELTARGRAAMDAGDPRAAAANLGEALALWRGEVLSDLSDLDGVKPVAARLTEAHLAVSEDWAAAQLALGQHGAVVPELGALTEAHPLRERLWALRMLALYRSGRQADALAAYQDVRHRLDDQLGVQPSQELRTLYERILHQDRALDHPSEAALPAPLSDPTAAPKMTAVETAPGMPAGSLPVAEASPLSTPGWFRRAGLLRGRRSRWFAVAAVIVVASGLVAGGVVWAARSQTVTPLPPNSLGAVGPHGLVGDAVALGALPGALVEAAGSVWVLDPADSTVSRVDPDTRRVVQTIPDVGQDPHAIAASGDDIWVAALGTPVVTRINATANKVVDRITVGNQPAALVANAEGVWVANSADNTIQRIDPKNDKTDPPLPVGDGPNALALDGTTLWVANQRTATVSQIDIRTGERAAPDVPVDAGPSALALTPTDVWVTNSLSQTVSRIDRSSGRVARIQVGDGPSSLAVTQDGVWVSNTYAGSMSIINPTTNSVSTVTVHSSPRGVARVGDAVWVASAAFASTQHLGGTLTVAITGPFTTIDPASADDADITQAFTPVYDGLVSFRDGGPISSEILVPDLATELPIPVDGGKTYIFTIRQGIHYSDGRVVVASDFARGIRRALLGVAPTALSSVVGAQGCIDNPKAPHLCDLSRGVVADDATGRLVLHLTAPAPEFVYRLAAGVVPTPPGIPDGELGRTPIPSTGPYEVREFRADGAITLVRNPNFTPWSVAAQPAGYPDVIQYRVEKDSDSAVDDVLKGTADVTHSLSRYDLTATIPTRAHVSFQENTDFVYLNSKRAPFDNKQVRQALNFAVDRRALVALYPNGSAQASLSCQLLPPGFPGYRPYCPYQTGPADGPYLGPDLDKARALVRESGTTRIPITIHRMTAKVYQAFPDYIAQVLRSLGYTVTIEDFSADTGDGDPASPIFATFQIFTHFGWLPDYPSPVSFYDALASCHAPNFNQFCDPDIESLAKAAHDEGVSDPNASLAAWTDVDRRLTNAAAFLTIGNHRRLDIVSERVGNFQERGGVGPALSQLWVK
ncbi:MAG: BTAD domain-containing putative transcriptional regulator [Lapillicoccus sp.]